MSQRRVFALVIGEVQGVKVAALSKRHAKVEFASEETKPNVSEVFLVSRGGAEVIVVLGGVAST